MLRVLLASMVPCFAIGITGLLVTSIGRFLLALTAEGAVIAATVMTVGIMVVCAVIAAITERRRPTRADVHR